MNFLIANYGFPPNPGVGGRRWVKFAKYLAKAGHQVHVIHATAEGAATSTWEDDANTAGITRHDLPRKYVFDNPHFGNNQRVAITHRIKQRVARSWYQATSNRRFYDQAFRWKEPFLALAENLIPQHNIEIVVATGAPFYLLEYGAILRSRHPQLRLLCDLRDPWFGAINYGMAGLEGKRLDTEKQIFRFVCEHADWVTAPNPTILESQSVSGTTIPESKRYVLSHAFDDDDLPTDCSAAVPDDDVVRIVYGGAIYGKSQPVFDSICRGLDHMREVDPDFYQHVQFDLYINDRLPSELVQRHGQRLHVIDQIGSEIHKKVRDADWSMLLAAGHYKDAMTTKFFEFGRSGTPFLVFGESGELMDAVEKNSLGVCLETSRLGQEPGVLLDTLRNGFQPNSAYFDAHCYQSRTDELTRLFTTN
ncbi:glycosyltransferase family protein [Rhodopirellula europaea]|uniref:Glycosyl transferase, group 1 n=1 Tax=Rhodopirellula europaea SH398 TaxID=1263868 RepID=M5RZM5_9BACT|nr:glycosyl transferase group 1 [Rhodopirellula europaea]EMI24760.1 glycosyl transferase, group 1 [Rhodopirellula europaea SH398]